MARGDRLRVERRLAGSGVAYMHHGIDLGDGTVVHARPHDFRNPFGGGRVERTGLEAFCDAATAEIVTDPPARFPPDEIAARAVGQIGRQGYCPAIDNCEHFATWCATGERSSRQADIVLERLGGAVARVAATVAARGISAAAGRGGGRLVASTLLGAPFRLGLRTILPGAIAGEAAALAAEWTAHHAGRSPTESRATGQMAGLAACTAVCGLAGLPAGPAGVAAAAAAGAAAWTAGGIVARAAAAGRQVRPW